MQVNTTIGASRAKATRRVRRVWHTIASSACAVSTKKSRNPEKHPCTVDNYGLCAICRSKLSLAAHASHINGSVSLKVSTKQPTHVRAGRHLLRG